VQQGLVVLLRVGLVDLDVDGLVREQVAEQVVVVAFQGFQGGNLGAVFKGG
jgi:hypothetical protein